MGSATASTRRRKKQRVERHSRGQRPLRRYWPSANTRLPPVRGSIAAPQRPPRGSQRATGDGRPYMNGQIAICYHPTSLLSAACLP